MENNKKKRNHHPTATPTIVPTREIKIPPTYKPSNSLHQDPLPVPQPMNISNILISEDPLPVPVPPMNISSDPLPVPIPPMNISSDPLPVPVPPMNSTLNMVATSISDSSTSSTSLVYLPLVLLSGLLGIGFITYKRYKKRFAYTRIPENDTFDI